MGAPRVVSAVVLKSHVSGYTRSDTGTYVAPHEDKRPSAREPAKQISMEFREPTGGDQVTVFPYASGMSRSRDMSAAIESAAGLGTEIGELSSPAMDKIADAIAAGKPVFVDSGAFNAFKRALREGDPGASRLDFDRVFAKYNELSRRVREKAGEYAGHALLMMVAPDVIGDQEATLSLVEEHAEQIMDWIDAGHDVIVPFQKGPINQYEAFLRVREALHHMPFVVGIPSAAEALSAADLRQLVGQPYKPDRIHVLGAVSSRRMEERMAVIRDAYVDHVPGVTADAMVMRSKLHELGGLAGQEKFDKIKEILNRVVPAMWGGTKLTKSFLGDDDEVGFFTGAVLIAKALVHGHVKKDGTVVRQYERKDKNSRSAKFGRVFAAAIRAHDSLSRDAQHMLSGWNLNWHTSDFAKWDNGSEKSAELRQQVKEAFKPVRDVLRREFGDTVPLYRGQKEIGDDRIIAGRQLFSWSPDAGIASEYAHGRALPPEITDKQIANQFESYRRSGVAKLGRSKFVRTPPPDGYEPDGPDYYYIYEGHEMITDGDDLEEHFRSEQAERLEWIEKLKSRGRVHAAEVPVDDVVWIPVGPNLAQPELITTHNPLAPMVKSIEARYQRLLARRTDGTTEAMAAEDARLVDLTSSLVRSDEPTPAQAAAGNYAKRAVRWNGLTIRIENETGSVRRGATWETTMQNPYGYVERSEAVDGDEVDVYLGPFLETAPTVFVVHQRKAGDWSKYDEDKAMLGFHDEAEARQAYLAHYDDPRFLGPITAMPVAEFVAKVRATRTAPAMIKAVQTITRRDGVTQRYHIADPAPESSADETLADDLEAQTKWLTEQAAEMGYAGIEDLVVGNYPAFEMLAAKWRDDHPVSVALKSLADAMIKALVCEFRSAEETQVITKSIGADRRRIIFLKAQARGDDRTVDMFAAPAITHVEARTRKDGVVQKYHVSVEKIEAIHDKRKLAEKRDMLHDFLVTRPDSPNAERWRKEAADIDAQIGPKQSEKKDARKEPDMSNWTDHQKAAHALRREYEQEVMFGSSQDVGEFKRKIRRIAKTIPETDDKAVTQIDLLVTRVWGTNYDPKRADVEFAKTGDTKDSALSAAIAHLKEDAKQGDIPAAEKKEDAALVAKLEAAVNPSKARPKEEKPTSENIMARLDADDHETAAGLVARAKGAELEAVGDRVGFSRKYQEPVNAYRDRLVAILPELTRTKRVEAAAKKKTWDRLAYLAHEWDRMKDWQGAPEGSYDGKWLTHDDAEKHLLSELGAMRSAPHYDEMADMVRRARPRIFNASHAANFSDWFGDSKVVDADGNPMVMYHGTADSFDKFEHDHPNKKDVGWIGRGFYFSNDPELANTYANLKPGTSPNVMPVYLRITKPYMATIRDKERLMLADRRGDKNAAKVFTDELRQHGYDGVFLDYGLADGTKEYVAFDPEQIKSATGNNGGFDRANPVITKALPAPAIKLIKRIA
jgi:hypothetical protein